MNLWLEKPACSQHCVAHYCLSSAEEWRYIRLVIKTDLVSLSVFAFWEQSADVFFFPLWMSLLPERGFKSTKLTQLDPPTEVACCPKTTYKQQWYLLSETAASWCQYLNKPNQLYMKSLLFLKKITTYCLFLNRELMSFIHYSQFWVSAKEPYVRICGRFFTSVSWKASDSLIHKSDFTAQPPLKCVCSQIHYYAQHRHALFARAMDLSPEAIKIKPNERFQGSV